MKPPAPHKKPPAAVFAAALAALLAGGCASATTADAGHHAPAPAPASVSATASAPPGDPARVAARDAAALVDAFDLPPGSTRSAAEPVGTPKTMGGAANGPESSQRVVSTGWWVVDEPAAAAYSWLAAHNTGARDSANGYGSTSEEGYKSFFYTEPSTSILDERYVAAEIGASSADRTVIRVDAVETYYPTKPAAEVVPVAPYLIVTFHPGFNATGPGPAPHVVTDRSKIAKVAALINALPVRPVGEVFSCPVDMGTALGLTFRSAPGGAVLAEVDIKLGGCGGVDVTIGGASEPNLVAESTYPSGLAGQVESIVGLALPGN
jgi:hypothetical protein